MIKASGWNVKHAWGKLETLRQCYPENLTGRGHMVDLNVCGRLKIKNGIGLVEYVTQWGIHK
jgi:hypothetical protein